MKYEWINRRIEEMEEKANVTRLPTHDMDGCRFQVDPDWESNAMDDAYDDAYYESISVRMGKLMGIW